MERGDGRIVSGREGVLLTVAATMTWALVTMGGVVCTTGSGFGCAGWPGCVGGVVPPLRLDAIIEYTHRFFAITTFPLVIVVAVLMFRRHRAVRWLTRPLGVTIVLFTAVSIFGAFAVTTGLPLWAAVLDVGSALAALALVVAAAVVGRARRGAAGPIPRLSWRSPTGGLAAGAFAATYGVLISGVMVAAPGSIVRCLGWPLTGGGAMTAHAGAAGAGARLLLSVLAAAGVVLFAVQAWRVRRARPGLLPMAAAAAGLLAAEIALGAALPGLGYPMGLRVVYVALASGLWALLSAATVQAGLPAPAPAEVQAPAGAAAHPAS